MSDPTTQRPAAADAELPRIQGFLADFARRQAQHATPLPGGFAVRDDALPHSRADNQIFVDQPVVDAGALPTLADEALAGLPHRLITVLHDQAGQAVAPTLVAAGYEHSVYLLMLHTGPVPKPGSTAREAEEVDLDALRGPIARRWRGFLPDAEDEVIRQLVDRRLARRRGAEAVHFIASRDEDGEAACWADLYADPATGVAQIEDVLTDEARLRRGHGNAVLAEALRRAEGAGCATRFLIADADDWPRHWYERLGFTTIAHAHSFERG
ncbi:GNAT family N-acetyltransferase [Streptomyces profundus]|uniref:GNAT family N-acetyltransferase n=1 Tax=Streptomyces profundus TaxID=2867410 RepID=UPI001D169850|nr:GNAT family N-acetyltransferase [Streptomyces sp. MA3_2.13]UED87309.1 GNAT family N-acetyltransferase [Streptomyces sp. MA3_2.13]